MAHSGYLVLVFLVPLWSLSVLFSILICTVEGWSQLIGSSQPIMSAVGDDVILPCHAEPRLSVENMTVIWWKPGEPMSGYRYVHHYQGNHVEEDDWQMEEDLQMDSYVSRTSLFTDDMKHGNVSLKIKKVKLSDGGIYRCDIPQLFSDSFIILVVGAFVRTDCTPQSDPRCISCMNGTFMKKANGLIRCFLCSSCDRGPGVFTQQGCTATTDTVCDVVSGYFCKTSMDETGCSSAQKHSHCDPGDGVKRPGTSRTDTVCGSCPPGHFSLEGVSCTVWTTCSETEVKVKEGSASSDVVCVASRHSYGFIPALIIFILLITFVGLWIIGRLTSKNITRRARRSMRWAHTWLNGSPGSNQRESNQHGPHSVWV